MPQSRKKKTERPGMFEILAADLAKKGEDKTVVPPVTILKPPPPSGDMLLKKYYPNVSNSIPELLRAILQELLVVRYHYERNT